MDQHLLHVHSLCWYVFLFLGLSFVSESGSGQQDVLLLFQTKGWQVYGRRYWQVFLALSRATSAYWIQEDTQSGLSLSGHFWYFLVQHLRASLL